MSEDKTWLSKSKLPGDLTEKYGLKISNPNTAEWINTTTDFLLNCEIPSEENWEFSTEKLFDLVENGKPGRSKNIFPKETTVTEARRLAREEKFQHLTNVKKDKIIHRELRNMKESLENNRILQKINLDSMEEKVQIKRRKNKLRLNMNEQLNAMYFNNEKWQDFGLKQPSKAEVDGLAIIGNNSGMLHVTVHPPSPGRTITDTKTELKSESEQVVEIESENPSFEQQSVGSNDESPEIMSNFPEIHTIEISNKIVKDIEEDDEKLKMFEQRSLLRKKQNVWTKWKKYVAENKMLVLEENKWQEKIDKFIECLNSCSKEQKEIKECQIERKNRGKTAPSLKERDKGMIDEEDADLKAISNAVDESTHGTRRILRARSVQKFEPTLRGKARLIRMMTTSMTNDKEEKSVNFMLPQPSFLQEMNQRHMERKQRVHDIQEKKRFLEEEKDRIVKEKYERQLMEAELEKKLKLEAFREKLRKQRIAQEKQKQEFLRMQSLTIKADLFYRQNILIKYGFKPWRSLMELRNKQNNNVASLNERRLKRNFLIFLKRAADASIETRQAVAYRFWIQCSLRKYFRRWILACVEVKLLLQVADDWNDQLLLQRSIRYWQDFVVMEQRSYMYKWKKAIIYYRRKELNKYLKQWMLLPQVMYLEKEKEIRKQKWRMKIQEVLPDFNLTPSSDTRR